MDSTRDFLKSRLKSGDGLASLSMKRDVPCNMFDNIEPVLSFMDDMYTNTAYALYNVNDIFFVVHELNGWCGKWALGTVEYRGEILKSIIDTTPFVEEPWMITIDRESHPEWKRKVAGYMKSLGVEEKYDEHVGSLIDIRERLRSHLKQPDEWDMVSMQDVPESLFRDITPLVAYSEEDHSGVAYAFYTFEGKYFVVNEAFGSCSGCDEWSNDDDDCKSILDSIVDNIVFVDEPWKIRASDHTHPEWRRVIVNYMRTLGVEDEFHEQQKVYDDEWQSVYQESDKEYREKLKREEEARLQVIARKRMEHDQECIDDLYKLVKFFDEKSDPFYQEKFLSSLRRLKYCEKNVPINDDTKDAIIKAVSTLAEHAKHL